MSHLKTGRGSNARAQYAPQTLSQDQRLEINEAFQLFDMDKDKWIDYHELKVAMRALGFDKKKAEVLQILRAKGDGDAKRIHQDDFMTVSESPCALLAPLHSFRGTDWTTRHSERLDSGPRPDGRAQAGIQAVRT